MLNNWRSTLLFSKLAFRQDDNLIALLTVKDLYKPIEYVVLDPSRLKGESVLHWMKSNFGELGFDFDKYSMLSWPVDDNTPAVDLVTSINTLVPRFASTRLISPALAHGLDEISSLSFEDNASNIDEEDANNSDIHLHF